MSTNHHVLPLPKAVLALRIVQLVVAIVILGLSAYGVTFLSFDGDCLTLFTALATMIIAVYIIVASTGLPAAYNYWAILGLDIFAIVFWVISFSLLAWEIAEYSWYYTDRSSYTCTYYYGYCIKKRDLVPRATTDIYTYRNAMAAAAGLGGLEFILFIITLSITSVYLHRHRAAGGHCMPSVVASATVPGGPAPVVYEQKDIELQAPQGQPQQYQQPQYAQPPAQAPVQV